MASRFAMLLDEVDPDDRNKSSRSAIRAKKPNSQNEPNVKIKKDKKPKKKKHIVENPQPSQDKKCSEQIEEKLFRQDLEQAILMSKVDKEDGSYKTINSHPNDFTNVSDKKNQSFQKSMSLGEFQQLGQESCPRKVAAPAPKFDSVPDSSDKVIQNEVDRIVRQEKNKGEFEKKLREDLAFDERLTKIVVEHDKALHARDAQITALESTVVQWKTKHMKVSKEKIELHRTLEQVNNRDKTELVKANAAQEQLLSELTREMSEMRTELERERSQSGLLRIELERLKEYQRK